MSWTPPRTWISGETVTASLMNAQIRDNENILKTSISDDGKIQAINSTYFESLDGSALELIPKKLSAQIGSVGNVGGGEDDLMSYLLPGGTLSADFMALRITAWGTFAANGNGKTVKGYFGSLTVVGGPTNTDNIANHRWTAVFEIVRTGAATQASNGRFMRGDTVEGNEAVTLRTQGPTEDLSGDVTIKFTGDGTSNDDVTQTGMIVEFLP